MFIQLHVFTKQNLAGVEGPETLAWERAYCILAINACICIPPSASDEAC